VTAPTDLREALAPHGILRASINLGNPLLAHRDANGRPAGVSVDLTKAFADRLGVGLSLVVFDSAGKSVQAVGQDEADIGFFAIDPLRGETIAFTDAYVLIEGCYLVRADSPIRSNDEVDRDGLSIMVGKGSAYDLYLTRELRHARILRAPTSPAVVDTFLHEGADVAAGVKQQLEIDATRLDGLRLLDGHFMVIRQAMGCPKNRGPEAAAFLGRFVEEMKSGGFVAQALARHHVEGASVAPPAASGPTGSER
jgi:polar amino acid transport system substrate-binding protein